MSKNRKGRYVHDHQQTRINIAEIPDPLERAKGKKHVLTFHPIMKEDVDDSTSIDDAKIIIDWLNAHLSLRCFYHLGSMMVYAVADIEKRYMIGAGTPDGGGQEGQPGSDTVLVEDTPEGGVG